MEKDIGMELFVPAGRNVQLSPAGLELATRAQGVLLQLKEGLQAARLLSKRKPILRVGLLRSLGSDYMPRMVQGFAPAHAHIQFAFREGSGKRLEELLLSHEIDLALVAPPLSRPDISTVDLFEQRIDAVVANTSHLASLSSIDLGNLSDESFILPETGYGSRSITDMLFERAGIRPNVILETDDMTMAVAMAAAGIGIALTPPTPTAHTGAVRVPLSDTQARRTVAACHLTTTQLPAHCKDFLKHLRSHAPGSLD